jgi:DNA-binding MarR family transcriptional regulator
MAMSACPQRRSESLDVPSLRVVNDEPTTLTAAGVLDEDYLQLPRAAMQAVGPATQTLGAILRLTGNRTFRTIDEYAGLAWLKRRTVMRHLDTLVEAGWLEDLGRERMTSGRVRRTVTYRLTERATESRKRYAMLPRWAARAFPTWASRAVFALVVSRHVMVQRKTEDDRGNSGLEEHSTYSLSRLVEESGLHKESVLDAKQWLVGEGLIEAHDSGHGTGHVLSIGIEFELSEAWILAQVEKCHRSRSENVTRP